MSVEYRLEDDVAIVTLNRPDSFNAITRDLAAGLVDALGRAGGEARAAVVTGAGKAFCAGADLGEISEGYEKNGPNLGQVLDETFHPAVHALLDCKVPVIGAINGAAAGAGLGLALACDLRFMAEGSFLMSAFAGIALAPDSGTTWWLPHHLGVSRALDITLTNRRVMADEAHALGLCLEVVTPEQLLGTARAKAADLADLAPDSLVTTRKLIRNASGSQFEQAIAAEREEQDRLGKLPAHAEGVQAFLEKRKPDYRGVTDA